MSRYRVVVVTLAVLMGTAAAEVRTEKWANGAKAEETTFVDGVPHGPSKRWYQDGTLALDASYDKGLLHGPYVLYNVYGKVIRSGTYERGVEHGRWIENHPDGVPLAKGSYDKGMRTTAWRIYTRDNNEAAEVPPDFKAVGTWWAKKEPCEPGTELVDDDPDLRTCALDSGILHGPHTAWHDSMVLDEGGHYEGRRKTPIKLQGSHRIGRRNGYWAAFHENGKKQWQGMYADGMPTGTWTFWDKRGKQLGKIALQETDRLWTRRLVDKFWEAGDAACPAGAKLVGKVGNHIGCELPGGFAYGPAADWRDDALWQLTVMLDDQPMGRTLVHAGERVLAMHEDGLLDGAMYLVDRKASSGEDAFFIGGVKAHRHLRFYKGVLREEKSYSHEKLQFDSTEWNEGKLWKVESYVRGERTATKIAQGKPVPPPVKRAPQVGSQWWKKAAPCPHGTALVGGVAPSGMAYCARPDGTRHGPFTKWWGEGGVADEGAFVDGKQDGAWRLYYPDGALLEVSTWKAGLRTGAFTEYSDTGTVTREGAFADGVPHGPWVLRDPSGTVTARGTYDRGLRGPGWKERSYTDLASYAPVPHDWHTKPGACPAATKLQDWGGEYVCFDASYRHGPYTRVAGKKILARGYYRFNTKHGPWTTYHRNGKKQSEGNYVDGVRDGAWTFWDAKGKQLATVTIDARAWRPADAGCPDGTKQTGTPRSGSVRCTYPDGGETGAASRYHKGKLVEQGYVRDGARWGWWTRTGSEGTRHTVWFFANTEDGVVRSHLKGALVREIRYRLGETFGRESNWSGEPATIGYEGPSIRGRRHGRWTKVVKGQLERVDDWDNGITLLRTTLFEQGKPVVK